MQKVELHILHTDLPKDSMDILDGPGCGVCTHPGSVDALALANRFLSSVIRLRYTLGKRIAGRCGLRSFELVGRRHTGGLP